MSLDPAEVESRLENELFTKYNSFMPTTNITEQEFSTLVTNVLKVEAQSNAAASTALPVNSVVSTIKIWALSPLDPASSSFAKALENERSYKETSELKLFNLEREKWITFRNNISTKSDRCCLEKILSFPLTNTSTVNLDLVKSFSQFSKARVKEFGETFWGSTAINPTMSAANKNAINDKRILSNMFGEFLISSLTLSAQNKVKIEKTDYQRTLDGVVYIDGAVVFWVIANLTQPNNDRWSEQFFEELRRLNVKAFKFSVKDMLDRFKELCLELDGHGVAYDENTKQLDFWRCLETMKETEFANFVNREREDYRKQPVATRPAVDTLMVTFIDKQTNMESDSKWNKLSMEQAQILSLLANNGSKNSSKQNSNTDKYQPRPWRTKLLKDGTPLEKVTRGGHTFKWDPAGNNGTGFWEYVKSKDGSEDSSPKDTEPQPVSDDNTTVPSKKKAKKTVSFDNNTKDATTISVNKSRLLANLAQLDDSQKSFLTQFVPKE